jgi:HK97 family phage major capsid protein
MSYTSRSNADALIPEDVANVILQETTQASAVLSNATIYRASTNQAYVPLMAALPAAGWLDGDIDTKPTTTAAWSREQINIAEIAAIAIIPEAVLEDANADLFGQMVPHLSAQFGKSLDEAVLFGNNKPSVFGTDVVAGAIAAGNVVVSGSGVDLAEDISAAMGAVEAGNYEVNGHLAPVALKQELRNLRDLNNNPIFSEVAAAQGSTVYGVSVNFSQNGSFDRSKAKVIVGDWSKLIVAVRTDIQFKVLDQATVGGINLAEQDCVAIRARARFGFAVPVPVSHDSGTSRYPFAVITPAGS